jgi:signal transduction histidine kinase
MSKSNTAEEINILLVDDKVENLFALEKMLQEDNRIFMKAESGKTALKMALNNEFALILLDVQMPEMDGFEVARLLRGNPKTKDIPIIFVTAINKDEDNVLKGYESGAVDYLFKPLNIAITKAKVDMFIRLHQQQLALEKAKKKAEESVKVKQDFMSSMSHEIRTPMNGIIGFTRMLEKTNLDEEQKKYLRSIQVSGENLLVIINDILDFSKIEAGKLNIDERPYDIKEVLEDIYQLELPIAQSKGVEFKVDLIDEVPKMLIGDSVRVNQIVLNLVSNALKFTEKGIVKVIASKLVEGEKIWLSIKCTDSGIGISKEKQEEIFSSFTQEKGDTSRKYGGTGLGLTIVKKLSELMGGSVRVESQVGKGATFEVLLPLNPAEIEVEEKQIEENIEDVDISGTRVLLAEDNEMNQLLARKVLQSFGIDVVLAENGLEALETLEKDDFDIILMDIMMPEMDGLEATKKIRSDFSGLKQQIPILAMTAYVFTGGDDKKIEEAGMNDFILKPFHPDNLKRKIAALTKN